MVANRIAEIETKAYILPISMEVQNNFVSHNFVRQVEQTWNIVVNLVFEQPFGSFELTIAHIIQYRMLISIEVAHAILVIAIILIFLNFMVIFLIRAENILIFFKKLL
jgi:hypothetical protein